MAGKRIEKYRVDTYTKVIGLGKFKSEGFEADEVGFHNLISQKTGTTNAELRYVIPNRVIQEVSPDFATERMYQIRISGEAFGEDNRTFFRRLK